MIERSGCRATDGLLCGAANGCRKGWDGERAQTSKYFVGVLVDIVTPRDLLTDLEAEPFSPLIPRSLQPRHEVSTAL